MLRATLRWTLILFCLFALGPLVRVLVLRVYDADGGHAVTLAVNATFGAALVAGLAAILAAGLAGAAGAHFFSMGTGYTCAGITLAWARSRPGMSVRDTAHASGTAIEAAMSDAKLAIQSVGCSATLGMVQDRQSILAWLDASFPTSFRE